MKLRSLSIAAEEMPVASFVCAELSKCARIVVGIYMTFSRGVASFAPLADSLHYVLCISLTNYNRSKIVPHFTDFSIEPMFFALKRTNRHRDYNL